MPLAMVDDLLAINSCGDKSLNMNIMINSSIEMKKLRFHTPDEKGKSKCHGIHVGKQTTECPDIRVHGCPIEKVKSDTYLGDVILNYGKKQIEH